MVLDSKTADKTEKDEPDLGHYEGYEIVDTEIIVNKLGADLNGSAAIAPVIVDPNGFAYLAVKVMPTERRYRLNRNADGEIVNVTLVQRFNSVGAMFTEESKVGKPLQKTIDAVRAAEALAKRKQTSFELPDPDAAQERASEAGIGDLPTRVDDAFGGGGDAA